MGRMITEAELRENLSAILEEASRTGDGITIRREDGPDIQLRPVVGATAPLSERGNRDPGVPDGDARGPGVFGRMAGTVVILGDIVNPIPETWPDPPDFP